jgi:hypothetical protein
MSTIPSLFFPAHNLSIVIYELTTHAEAILADVLAIREEHHRYTTTTNTVKKKEFAVVLWAHGKALETDLGTIKLNAALITDERLADWVEAGASAAEIQARKKTLTTLTGKMQLLECMMADLKERMMSIEYDFV